MKTKWQTFNDGILELARDTAGSGSFGAKRNIESLEDLEVYECAHYQRMSIRVDDVDFAEQTGLNLSIKVRIRSVPEVRPGHKAVIGRDVYNIGSIDRSADGLVAYLYLEHVRELQQ